MYYDCEWKIICANVGKTSGTGLGLESGLGLPIFIAPTFTERLIQLLLISHNVCAGGISLQSLAVT